MSVNGSTVSLVMPCRNEGGHLADLISEVPSFFDEIICVSNKSIDSTVAVGKNLQKRISRFRLLQDDRTADGIGYGYAHMTGIDAAKSEIIVCADSDGTYPVEEVPRILAIMRENNLSFVSATRYPTNDIPFKLKFGVQLLNMEMLLLYGYVIHDSLSGMWVFKKSVSKDLELTEGDWNFSPQIKLNAKKYLKEHFAEVKITQKIRRGETKQSYLKTGLHHFLWIAKNRFSQRKRLQPHDYFATSSAAVLLPSQKR